MTDFEYDCMQKKRIARGAMNRKCGSKSKKCFLPSDHMTQKQWKERNGKVSTVKMNEPMSWEDFKNLSKDLQGEYLAKLIRRYNVTAKVIATEMFHIHSQYFCTYVRKQELAVKFQKGVSMSDRERDAWEKFLNSEPIEETPVVEEVAETPVAEVVGETVDTPAAEPAPEVSEVCTFDPSVLAMIGYKSRPVACQSSGTQLSRFSLSFEGELDIGNIANSIRGVLGDGRTGKLQIIYEQ